MKRLAKALQQLQKPRIQWSDQQPHWIFLDKAWPRMQDEGILELPSIALKFDIDKSSVCIQLASHITEPRYISGFPKTIDDV